MRHSRQDKNLVVSKIALCKTRISTEAVCLTHIPSFPVANWRKHEMRADMSDNKKRGQTEWNKENRPVGPHTPSEQKNFRGILEQLKCK